MDSTGQVFYTPPSFTPEVAAEVEYGGFFKRFAAYILDGIILSVISFAISQITSLVFSQSLAVDPNMIPADPNNIDPAMLMTILTPVMDYLIILGLVNFTAYWLYYAGFESSSLQGTPGKKALGMIVTDTDGDPVSFGLATGRYLGRLISGILLGIGYLFILFTGRKQALHDLIAGTLVVNKPRSY